MHFFCPDIQKPVFRKHQFGAPFKCLWPFNGKQWIQSSNPEPFSINNWPLFIHVKLICFLNSYCNTTIFSVQLQGKINHLIDHFWQANRLNWLHRKHTIELLFPSVFCIRGGHHSIYIKILRYYHISFLIYAGSIPLAFSTDGITTWDIQKTFVLAKSCLHRGHWMLQSSKNHRK